LYYIPALRSHSFLDGASSFPTQENRNSPKPVPLQPAFGWPTDHTSVFQENKTQAIDLLSSLWFKRDHFTTVIRAIRDVVIKNGYERQSNIPQQVLDLAYVYYQNHLQGEN
jgi:hypothetical protein